jgi:hypothetical protein
MMPSVPENNQASSSDNPPVNTHVLILIGNGKRAVWHKAIYAQQRGREGLRWRIWLATKCSVIAGGNFKPLAWLPLLPENGRVQ